MKSRPWYKRFPADFLNGVEGIGPEIIGCYAVVLDMIYDRGGAVPNDARLIGGRLGCSPRLARSLINNLIDRGKLFLAPGGLSNTRAETEIEKAKLNRLNLIENGSKGGRKRAENAGQSLHFNEIVQARLKHRAGVIFQKEENTFLVQSVLPREQKKEGPPEEAEPTAPPEPLAPSSALLGTRLLRKAS